MGISTKEKYAAIVIIMCYNKIKLI